MFVDSYRIIEIALGEPTNEILLLKIHCIAIRDIIVIIKNKIKECSRVAKLMVTYSYYCI